MHTGSGFPAIIGFDLPGAQQGPGPARVIVTALLDKTPPEDWIRVLHREAWPSLRLTHAVEQVRVVAQGIHLVGAIADPRALSISVRELAERVSAKVLARRLEAMADPDDEVGLSGPGPAVAHSSTDPRLADVAALLAMPAVPGMLELASALTGMRFVAVARVAADRWTACAVHDRLGFGLQPGQDLVLETTICDEIRQHRQTVQFDHASMHPVFSTHPTPALYGFESYISVPVLRRDGAFYGTLCALDPLPSKLEDASLRCFQVLAGVIGAHLDLEEGAAAAAEAPPSTAEVLARLGAQLDALEAAGLPERFRDAVAQVRRYVLAR